MTQNGNLITMSLEEAEDLFRAGHLRGYDDCLDVMDAKDIDTQPDNLTSYLQAKGIDLSGKEEKQKASKKFFFSQDDSCHWYMIPAYLREEWNKAQSLDLETDEGWTEWERGNWEGYRTGGGIEKIEFCLPASPAPESSQNK